LLKVSQPGGRAQEVAPKRPTNEPRGSQSTGAPPTQRT
jgi:hypothetical protein